MRIVKLIGNFLNADSRGCNADTRNFLGGNPRKFAFDLRISALSKKFLLFLQRSIISEHLQIRDFPIHHSYLLFQIGNDLIDINVLLDNIDDKFYLVNVL